MVDLTLIGAHHWLKAFCIEVAVIYIVPYIVQSADDATMDRRLEAVLHWMRIDD